MEYMESKMQDRYEAGNAMHAELEKVTAERNSYLVELQKANAVIIDLQRNPPKLLKEHLAEIKAQAVQDFIQFMYSQDNCQLCNSSLDIASKYADSIRRSEVKL